MLHAYHKCCTNGTCNVFFGQSFRNHQIIWMKKVKPVLLKKKLKKKNKKKKRKSHAIWPDLTNYFRPLSFYFLSIAGLSDTLANYLHVYKMYTLPHIVCSSKHQGYCSLLSLLLLPVLSSSFHQFCWVSYQSMWPVYWWYLFCLSLTSLFSMWQIFVFYWSGYNQAAGAPDYTWEATEGQITLKASAALIGHERTQSFHLYTTLDSHQLITTQTKPIVP